MQIMELTNLKYDSVIFSFDSTNDFVGISIIELNKNEIKTVRDVLLNT